MEFSAAGLGRLPHLICSGRPAPSALPPIAEGPLYDISTGRPAFVFPTLKTAFKVLPFKSRVPHNQSNLRLMLVFFSFANKEAQDTGRRRSGSLSPVEILDLS